MKHYPDYSGQRLNLTMVYAKSLETIVFLNFIFKTLTCVIKGQYNAFGLIWEQYEKKPHILLVL